METEELLSTLTSLVEKSEARIDRTNAMIQQLTQICQNNIEVYDKHLTSLENSRNSAQESAMASLKLSADLAGTIARLRDDYQAQITSLKAELHTLRDNYRKELEEMRRDYKDLHASYRRLAERSAGGTNAEVKIG